MGRHGKLMQVETLKEKGIERLRDSKTCSLRVIYVLWLRLNRLYYYSYPHKHEWRSALAYLQLHVPKSDRYLRR